MPRFLFSSVVALGFLSACVTPDQSDLPSSPAAQAAWVRAGNMRAVLREDQREISRPLAAVSADVQEYFRRCIDGQTTQVVATPRGFPAGGPASRVVDETLYRMTVSKQGGVTYVSGIRQRVGRSMFEPLVELVPDASGTRMSVIRAVTNGPTAENLFRTANGERMGCARLAM